MTTYPIGKLPPELLKKMLMKAPITDPRVILGPGIGLDCSVVDLGHTLLVFKSDPITFATDEIGWYAVQVSANDIATAGAVPRWFMVTALLPENKTDAALVDRISEQIFAACRDLEISVIGGHTEITFGLDRPILVGTMIGDVSSSRLVTPRGAAVGDSVLLTKGIPIEATALLAREFPERLRPVLGEDGLREAANFLHNPGISVLHDARVALSAGRVTAMHDPTEGGLASALWELTEASGHSLVVDLAAIPIPEISMKVCQAFAIDPLAAIASGALLMTAPAADESSIIKALESEGIACSVIGKVELSSGTPGVFQESQAFQKRALLPRPVRDEIAKIYD